MRSDVLISITTSSNQFQVCLSMTRRVRVSRQQVATRPDRSISSSKAVVGRGVRNVCSVIVIPSVHNIIELRAATMWWVCVYGAYVCTCMYTYANAQCTSGTQTKPLISYKAYIADLCAIPVMLTCVAQLGDGFHDGRGT